MPHRLDVESRDMITAVIPAFRDDKIPQNLKFPKNAPVASLRT